MVLHSRVQTEIQAPKCGCRPKRHVTCVIILSLNSPQVGAFVASCALPWSRDIDRVIVSQETGKRISGLSVERLVMDVGSNSFSCYSQESQHRLDRQIEVESSFFFLSAEVQAAWRSFPNGMGTMYST